MKNLKFIRYTTGIVALALALPAFPAYAIDLGIGKSSGGGLSVSASVGRDSGIGAEVGGGSGVSASVSAGGGSGANAEVSIGGGSGVSASTSVGGDSGVSARASAGGGSGVSTDVSVGDGIDLSLSIGGGDSGGPGGPGSPGGPGGSGGPDVSIEPGQLAHRLDSMGDGDTERLKRECASILGNPSRVPAEYVQVCRLINQLLAAR